MTPETLGPFIGALLLSIATFIYSFLKSRKTNGHIDTIELDLRDRINSLELALRRCEREKLDLIDRLVRQRDR